MSNDTIEQKIIEKGLEAPRITQNQITSKIARVDYYVFPGTLHTVCCLTLFNGFTIIGDSPCVHPNNFDEVIGREIAYEDAADQIWELEGYRLKHDLWLEKQLDSTSSEDKT